MKNSNVDGSTLLEVIVAMVILTSTTLILMYAISSADKLYGKGKKISLIDNIADNELQRLRMYSFTADTLYDSTYTIELERRSFYIKRTVTPYTPLDSTISDFPYPYVVVEIYDKEEDEIPLKTFRMIHGFAKKK